MSDIQKPAELSATAVATNALATATIPAQNAASRIQITNISASYSGTASGLVQVKAGATVIWRRHVNQNAPLDEDFVNPLIAPSNTAVSVELAAGGAGIDGAVSIAGFAF